MTLLTTILILIGAMLLFGPAAMASPGLRDAMLRVIQALPASASASTTTDPIDTGTSTVHGVQPGNVEWELQVPALTTTMLPDTKTMTYVLEHDDDPAFGSAETLNVGSLVQTGAGGAGAAASTLRFRLPANAKRYIRAKATAGSDVTDSSTKSMTLEAVF